MSFAFLPDDILLQLFTFLDFHATISLRQTCRRCYVLSKAKAVWLDSFHWLTRDSEDWRALLDDSPASRSSQYLEDVVTKTVRFETNWNNGQLRHFRYFLAPEGYLAALVPGGRWFLASVNQSLGTLLYHDLDSRASEIKGRVLVDHHQEGWIIWTMDFAVDPTAAQFEFDLALELATEDQAFRERSGPRKIAIWRVLNHHDELVAELTCSFSVFRASTYVAPISLQGEFLLRVSYGRSRLPVYAVHRWKGLAEGVVSHSLLLPQAKLWEFPEAGVRLLPDGRIVSVFLDRVELHAPPKECWEEGPIPQDMPRIAPQWVFEYKPPVYQLRSSVSRLMYYPKLNSVAFSFHNRESLFTFRIVTDQDSLPDVTTIVYEVMEDREYIGLGTSHAIRNTPGQKEAVLITFPQSAQLPALRSFAGVTNQISNAELGGSYSVTETLFKAPLPSAGGGWEIDEQSGRVLCTLRGRWDHYAVLYF